MSEEPYVRESYAVWELTLACNLACRHCGSRAGDARAQELSTAEALDLVRQLAELGITEVTIEGGEAFLRSDWLEIAAAITDAGMRCTMTSGGYGVSRTTVQRMKDVGIRAVSISLDGLEATHDEIRGRKGSWKLALQTMGHLREVGVPFGANTQINRLSAPEIPRVYEHLHDAGIKAWQFQLTQAMGNAADYPDMLLQPYELLDLYPMLARVMRRAHSEGISVQAGNNVGYHGPFEHDLRPPQGGRQRVYLGCQAGLATLGIHADGSIKACPTLPQWYVGGNIRETPLAEIVEHRKLTFNMKAGTPEAVDDLWGFCRGCEHASICRAGCSVSSHTLFGRRGNNVFCHHRALSFQDRGVRERITQKLVALGKPFDHATFEIVEEPIDAAWPESDTQRFSADRVEWPASYDAWP